MKSQCHSSTPMLCQWWILKSSNSGLESALSPEIWIVLTSACLGPLSSACLLKGLVRILVVANKGNCMPITNSQPCQCKFLSLGNASHSPLLYRGWSTWILSTRMRNQTYMIVLHPTNDSFFLCHSSGELSKAYPLYSPKDDVFERRYTHLSAESRWWTFVERLVSLWYHTQKRDLYFER